MCGPLVQGKDGFVVWLLALVLALCVFHAGKWMYHYYYNSLGYGAIEVIFGVSTFIVVGAPLMSLGMLAGLGVYQSGTASSFLFGFAMLVGLGCTLFYCARQVLFPNQRSDKPSRGPLDVFYRNRGNKWSRGILRTIFWVTFCLLSGYIYFWLNYLAHDRECDFYPNTNPLLFEQFLGWSQFWPVRLVFLLIAVGSWYVTVAADPLQQEHIPWR